MDNSGFIELTSGLWRAYGRACKRPVGPKSKKQRMNQPSLRMVSRAGLGPAREDEHQGRAEQMLL